MIRARDRVQERGRKTQRTVRETCAGRTSRGPRMDRLGMIARGSRRLARVRRRKVPRQHLGEPRARAHGRKLGDTQWFVLTSKKEWRRLDLSACVLLSMRSTGFATSSSSM